MEFDVLAEAVKGLEKANASLQPELLAAPDATKWLEMYARAEKLAAFGVAALSRKLDDACAVAKATGTPLGRAKDTVRTGKVLRDSEELASALQGGEISLEQAAEIAKAEESAPGAARDLVDVAREKPFQVLRDEARRRRLDAEQHRDLGARQREARRGAPSPTTWAWSTSTSPSSPTSAPR